MARLVVLFVCVENSCRSQMAEGWARHLFGDKLDAYSAGSKPSGAVNSDAIKAMSEINIDISAQRPKSFTDLPVKKFDCVITMGCQDACPFFPAKEHLDWRIEDPKGKGLDVFRRVREEIGQKVRGLI
ncbi:MAG TPA: arsenate reductase ArsC [Candidatus Omnitrophota bacterium]|nr:arsenate reductase ArsC [Candidatus Omnitrophota bacterium]